MARQDNFAVNPYLFLLLKQKFLCEVGYFYSKATNLNAARYFVLPRPINVNTINKLIETQIEDGKAFPKGTEHFKRQLLNNVKDFYCTEYLLNQVAERISFLGSYGSWNHFVEQETTWFADETDKYKQFTYEQLKANNVLPIIWDRVDVAVSKSYREALRDGKFFGRKLRYLLSVNAFKIRCTEQADLINIHKLLLSENSTYNKHLLLAKVDGLFYIIENVFGQTVGHIGIIPIKEGFLIELLAGTKQISDLTYFDISNVYSKIFLLTDLYYESDVVLTNILNSLKKILVFQLINNSYVATKDGKRMASVVVYANKKSIYTSWNTITAALINHGFILNEMLVNNSTKILLKNPI